MVIIGSNRFDNDMQHWLSTLAIVIVACSAIRHYESCTSLVHIVAKPLRFFESFVGLGKYGIFAPASVEIQIPVKFTSQCLLEWEDSPGKSSPNLSWPALTAKICAICEGLSTRSEGGLSF